MNLNEQSSRPELLIGLVGPIGVDMDTVTECLKEELGKVRYKSEVIHVTTIMRAIENAESVDENDYAAKYHSLIDLADEFRKRCKDNSALAGLAMTEIRSRREALTSELRTKFDAKDDDVIPSESTAYIIRQFKRPEEIKLMRTTYGRKFIQFSVYSSRRERIERITGKIQKNSRRALERSDCESEATNLVQKDFNEKNNEFGQRISDVFHTGDVFVYGNDKKDISHTVSRFIRAFFGDNSISPNRDEYGLYTAAASSLRSADLSRQVGAAIFSDAGEIISMGSNEVPKSGGGTYWHGDENLHRDVDEGHDPNHKRKTEILFDFISQLAKLKRLEGVGDTEAEIDNFAEELLKEDPIKNSLLMDIIEFGRMTHAEMSAIMDAARTGRSTKNATLFCTTFPCHMCAKHIVGAGIKRVVFLEPYPKSYADDLHRDSITFEDRSPEKVLFEPFIGISPRRYRDIFEKGRRKDSEGNLVEWYEGEPLPRIEDRSAAYLSNEQPAIASSLGDIFEELQAQVSPKPTRDSDQPN